MAGHPTESNYAIGIIGSDEMCIMPIGQLDYWVTKPRVRVTIVLNMASSTIKAVLQKLAGKKELKLVTPRNCRVLSGVDLLLRIVKEGSEKDGTAAASHHISWKSCGLLSREFYWQAAKRSYVSLLPCFCDQLSLCGMGGA